MAEFYLNLPIQYFPDPANGRPVSNGNVYIGIPDLDPEVEANRVPVVIIEEDGTRVVIDPSAQPLLTSPGGVVTYQGSYVSVLIDGSYSIKVNDSAGDQAYYVANVQGAIQAPLNDYNLVENGSFEIDSNNDGLPDNWDITVIVTGSVAIDPSTRIAGTQSLQFISAGSGAGDAVSAAFFEVSELRGIQVLFSLMSSVANIRNLVQIIWYDSNLLQLSDTTIYDNELTNSLAWADNITNVDVPTLATFAKLHIFGAHPSNPNPGSAWYDNIRVTEIATPASIVQPTLIATAAPREIGNITGATQVNPVVVTQIAHGFSTGDKVFISGVLGMVEINDTEFTVTVTGVDIYTLGVDGTSYTAYVSGGTGEIDEYILTTVPATAILDDGEIFIFRATSQNKTSTPEVTINGLGKKLITRQGNNILGPEAIRDVDHDVMLRYSSANDVYEMINPFKPPSNNIFTTFSSVSTGAATIPRDDTIPQNTEGFQVMSESITPTDVDSIITVDLIVNAANSSAANTIIVALFQDSIADSVASCAVRIASPDDLLQLALHYEIPAGTLNQIVFDVRIGGAAAGTTTFNGESGSQRFGGVINSYIKIREVRK